jgi:DNA invertase Pin-like site-specific DNA recombinase
MLAVFAEFEREILRDRVRRRLRCRQQSQIAFRAMFRQSIN